MSQPLIVSFRPDAAAMCLDGRKGRTRRIAAGLVYIPDDSGGAVYRNGRCLWRVGETVAIKPARTARAVGRVLVTSLRIEHVQDITEEDAKREGVATPGTHEYASPKHGFWTADGETFKSTSRECFICVWRRLYPTGPRSWDANPLVVVIGFEPETRA